MATSKHTKHPLNTLAPGRVLVAGHFLPKGASSPGGLSAKGVASVARQGVGHYRLTLEDKWQDLEAAMAQIRTAAANGYRVDVGDYNSSNKTLDIYVYKEAPGHIPLDLTSLREIATNDIQALSAHGGLLASDSDPSLARVNGATDKALRVIWDTSNDTDEAAFPPVPWPADLDPDVDVTVHLMAAMESTNDTPKIDVQAFEGVGDTEMGEKTAALSDTLAEVTATLGAADITGHPGFLNLALVPEAHTNDALYLYAAWIEYTRKLLVDPADDANNEIGFQLYLKETSVP